MKKFFSTILLSSILLSFVLVFSSCKKEDETPAGFDISGYSIVISETAGDDLSAAAGALKNRIEESAKVSLIVKDDWNTDGEDISSAKEILIGNTNREETASAKAVLDKTDNEEAYFIEVSENKIVILGKSEDITIRAIKYFATNFVGTSKKEGTLALDAGFKTGGIADTSTTIFPENLIEFSYSQKYNIYGNDINITSTLSYPKMIQLQHQPDEADNGTLVATLNSGDSFYRILKSFDDGETWREAALVYDSVNIGKGIFGGRMPYLYEMPVDMGDFKKGDLILAGTSSDGNSGKVNLTTITFYASKDLGESWETLYNIDYGGGQFFTDKETGVKEQVDLGVWEPFLMYEESTDRIYCFYSDDSDPEHDQKLVYKYTEDMKTWVGKDGVVGENGADGDPFEIVACDDKDYRPGMISVVKMNNGEYLAVYDIVVYAEGRKNGEIVVDGVKYNYSPDLYKKADSIDGWDIADPGTVPQLSDGRYMGLSPWVTYSPTIGETGMLVIYGRTWANTDKSATDLFISFDYGETYVTLDSPFEYVVGGKAPSGKDNNCGYSPALFFSADGKTLYFAVNTFNKYDTGYSVDLVKIDIIY